MNEPLKNQFMAAFSSPVLLRQWPGFEEVNAGLKQMILEREPKDPLSIHSNVGGWHSEQDVLTWGGPAIGQLQGWIQMALTDLTMGLANLSAPPGGQMTMVAWANVLRRGGYHLVHDHNTYAFSGVYYVEVGESDPGQINNLSGMIEFIDPRSGIGAIKVPGDPFKQKMRIPAEPGVMLVFPSWLKHYVHPYHGPGMRISISFNVLFKDLD